jgi:hypothetical protein
VSDDLDVLVARLNVPLEAETIEAAEDVALFVICLRY